MVARTKAKKKQTELGQATGNKMTPTTKGQCAHYLHPATLEAASGHCLQSRIVLRPQRAPGDPRAAETELHSALHTLLASSQEILLFGVRQPLDLLADSEIIVGATRIPPREPLENPLLIPKDRDSVVYCTCPSDETSRRVLHRALAMHFLRIKVLEGGLAGWKAKGDPVEPL